MWVRWRNLKTSDKIAVIGIAVLGVLGLPSAILAIAGVFSSGNVSTSPTVAGGGSTPSQSQTTTTNRKTSQTHPPPAVPPRYVDSLQQSETSNSATLGEANVSGLKFHHGVTINSLAGTAAEPNGVRFVLPGKFTAFRATVGVDPNSEPGFSGSIGVVVYAGGRVAANTVVSSGSPPCNIDVSVSEAGTLGLGAYFKSGEPMSAAFGEPRVVAGKDLAGMPSASRCP